MKKKRKPNYKLRRTIAKTIIVILILVNILVIKIVWVKENLFLLEI